MLKEFDQRCFFLSRATLDRYGRLLPETQQYIGERLDALVFASDQPRANDVLTQPA